MADQRPGVVSNESVALNEQIRTHDDSEARERERVERHAFKAPDQAAAQSALRPRAVVPSTFIVRLVGLPGPVELRNVVDGLELYRSVGDADVNVLVEIDGGTDRVLHIELLLPSALLRCATMCVYLHLTLPRRSHGVRVQVPLRGCAGHIRHARGDGRGVAQLAIDRSPVNSAAFIVIS